jgi:hypothetical protein
MDSFESVAAIDSPVTANITNYSTLVVSVENFVGIFENMLLDLGRNSCTTDQVASFLRGHHSLSNLAGHNTIKMEEYDSILVGAALEAMNNSFVSNPNGTRVLCEAFSQRKSFQMKFLVSLDTYDTLSDFVVNNSTYKWCLQSASFIYFSRSPVTVKLYMKLLSRCMLLSSMDSIVKKLILQKPGDFKLLELTLNHLSRPQLLAVMAEAAGCGEIVPS